LAPPANKTQAVTATIPRSRFKSSDTQASAPIKRAPKVEP
jgi:hypothetical protein